MGGLLLRILYHIMAPKTHPHYWAWMFLFVDDLLALLDIHTIWQQATLILITLEALGAPINYKKVRIGMDNVFVGFGINIKEHYFYHTEEKVKFLMTTTDQILNNRTVEVRHIRDFTYRAAWAVQILEPLRPFLQPCYTLVTATLEMKKHQPITIPAMTRYVISYIRDQWARRSKPSTEYRTPLPLSAATDAGASENAKTCGGWVGPPGGARGDMEWFAINLVDYLHLSWVKELLLQLYPGSQPSAASGALELLADLFLLNHLRPKIHKSGVYSTATASTDNSGNSYVLAKHYTNRWPGAAILMEMAAILLETDAHMTVSHQPRERNVWADDLANFNFAGFDPEKRWDPIEELGNTILLDDILRHGRELGLHLPKSAQTALHNQKQPTGHLRQPDRHRKTAHPTTTSRTATSTTRTTD